MPAHVLSTVWHRYQRIEICIFWELLLKGALYIIQFNVNQRLITTVSFLMRRGNLETPPDGENEKKLINKFSKAAQAGF